VVLRPFHEANETESPREPQGAPLGSNWQLQDCFNAADFRLASVLVALDQPASAGRIA
jgi:phage terminase large subunit-like protein